MERVRSLLADRRATRKIRADQRIANLSNTSHSSAWHYLHAAICEVGSRRSSGAKYRSTIARNRLHRICDGACWHGNRSMGADQSRPILERQDCAQSRSSTDSLRTLRADAASNLYWSSARHRRNCGSCEPMARRAGVCAAVYQLFDQGETGGKHSSCSLSGRVRRSQEPRRFPAAASVLKEII